MQPPAEHVHWLFATGFLLLGLCLLARAVVGEEVWSRRPWRLGPDDDARGRRRARPRPREVAPPRLAVVPAALPGGLRCRATRARAERLVLRARRLPAPRTRLDGA